MENLKERLKELMENEARSGSMDFGCITPLYVESFGYNDPYLDKESYLSSHLVVNDMDNVIAI